MEIRATMGLIAMALAAVVAEADDTKDTLAALTAGDRVQLVVAGRKTLRATINSITANEIVVRSEGSADPVRFDLLQLQSLDVAQGSRSQWRKGAAIGFVPGFLLTGLLIGVLTCIDLPDCSFRPGYAVAGGVLGGVATGSVGALVGLAVKREQWVRVYERKPAVSFILAPTKGGTRVGVSIAF
ncbi:MAG: hypothetical protein ABI565_05655 [Vicinamibacteria bacterium]